MPLLPFHKIVILEAAWTHATGMPEGSRRAPPDSTTMVISWQEGGRAGGQGVLVRPGNDGRALLTCRGQVSGVRDAIQY